jgi:hypothetical protein
LLISRYSSSLSQTLVITTHELLAITKTTQIASITGDLSTAEKILTQEIIADIKNFASYANRSFVMARKLNWENALQDATKVKTTQHAQLKIADLDGFAVPCHTPIVGWVYRQGYCPLRKAAC